MAAQQDGKWRGTVTEVIPAPVDKVWAILVDFDGLHRHFPQLFSKCDTIEGELNKVGSVRALVAPLPDDMKLEVTERLVHCDDVSHTSSYSMETCNLGWTGYSGHFSAKSIEEGQTLVSWGYELNPISGLTEAEYTPRQNGFFESLLRLLKGAVSN